MNYKLAIIISATRNMLILKVLCQVGVQNVLVFIECRFVADFFSSFTLANWNPVFSIVFRWLRNNPVELIIIFAIKVALLHFAVLYPRKLMFVVFSNFPWERYLCVKKKIANLTSKLQK